MEETLQKLAIQFSKTQNELFFPKDFFPKYSVCPKGRRGGLTKGAANALIEYGLIDDGSLWFLPRGPIYALWGDTVSTNIQKYIERYFLPVLKQLDPSQWRWHTQNQVMTIGRLVIDFRSADRPENWEGFGYHLIFLNEAGIILEDRYLFDNTVLPMLMDFPTARLIAAGTPKGKRSKGQIHRYFELYQQAQHDKENYRIIRFTGRDNPFIVQKELEMIAANMDETTRRQEIDGEFVDTSERKFLYAFKEDVHVIPSYQPNPHLPILVSVDFNKDPMTCVIGQQIHLRKTIIFDEIEINSGSTPEICDEILKRYSKWRCNIQVTGDATGRNRSALVRGNLNHYIIIKKEFGLLDRNLLVPTQNPSHKDSRVLCNSVLQNAEVRITKNCQRLVNDLVSACVDAEGELIKNNQIPLHLFDGFRYYLHAQFSDFITHPHKYK